MSLQARIGARIKQLREEKCQTQEELARAARSDAATLSRVESGKRNVTAETLAHLLIALGTTPRDFFRTPEFGESLAANSDDPDSVDSEQFAVESIAGGVRVHFPCGKYEAAVDLPGLERRKVAEAVLLLRRGLRQAELTPWVAGEGGEVATTTLMSAAIAECYLSLVQGRADLNPSDVWRYVVTPAFCDPHNHPDSSFRKDLAQSFKRTGGWAFERIVAAHYSPYLDEHGVLLTRKNPQQLLEAMGLAGRVPLDKIDLFIAARQDESLVALGVIHFKSSIAERRTGDGPASKLAMDKGFLSLFVTLDGKDAPSPAPRTKANTAYR